MSEIEWERYANTPFRAKVLGLIEPERAPLRAAVDELIASGFRDPEGLFYQAIKLAHAGDLDRAVEILADVVDRGFYPFETFTRHAWLDPLRTRQDFNAILATAELRHQEARAAFVNAGGETLLGVEARILPFSTNNQTVSMVDGPFVLSRRQCFRSCMPSWCTRESPISGTEHESCAQLGTGDRVGAWEGSWIYSVGPGDRKYRGMPGMQFSPSESP